MPSNRSSLNTGSTESETPRSHQDIDIDDAAIDETASVNPDENLVELSNPDDAAGRKDESDRPKGAWRGRDADRRANGADDLKA
jgi:hypothetical protein